MTKFLIYIFGLTFVFYSCNNPATEKKIDPAKIISVPDTINFNVLHGTWVRQNKEGFTLIVIKDTDDILYFQVSDRESENDTATKDRFWYYKSKARMGYWNKSSIWISTEKFRFDYKLQGDTLIEFDKMGDQGIFIKVFTDEQKAYQTFNAAALKGEITFVNKVYESEYFVLKNVDNEFSFTSVPDPGNGNKQFTDLAALGDSIIKPGHDDTLTLIKKQTKKIYKFGFLKR